MSFTTMNGKKVYIVDLMPELPELPIVGWLPGEEEFEKLLGGIGIKSNGAHTLARPSGVGRTKSDYATALQDAIETGVITEPGKYAIEVVRASGLEWGAPNDGTTHSYNIYVVNEPEEG